MVASTRLETLESFPTESNHSILTSRREDPGATVRVCVLVRVSKEGVDAGCHSPGLAGGCHGLSDARCCHGAADCACASQGVDGGC